QDQWDPARRDGPLEDEVDPDAVEFDLVVVEAIELALLGPPVESLGPVRAQVLQVSEVGALVPGRARRGGRPPCAPEPCPEVIEHVVLDGDAERLDGRGGCWPAHRPPWLRNAE